MHKKSRLEERIQACGDIVTVADLTDKNMLRAALTPEYLPFTQIFGNSNPVYLEIGCGKGKFVCETARLNPDINFIACEKISNVLIEALERVREESIKNIYFLNCAAEVLQKYLPESSVDSIFLNFSNPLPKEGYKKQRLTHPRFLSIYKQILKNGGEIIQKTDDRPFYEFSLQGFMAEGMQILSTCEDLAASPIDGDGENEHERRFKQMGRKIHRIHARVIK